MRKLALAGVLLGLGQPLETPHGGDACACRWVIVHKLNGRGWPRKRHRGQFFLVIIVGHMNTFINGIWCLFFSLFWEISQTFLTATKNNKHNLYNKIFSVVIAIVFQFFLCQYGYLFLEFMLCRYFLLHLLIVRLFWGDPPVFFWIRLQIDPLTH